MAVRFSSRVPSTSLPAGICDKSQDKDKTGTEEMEEMGLSKAKEMGGEGQGPPEPML